MRFKTIRARYVLALLSTPRFVRTPFLISYLCTFSLSLLTLVSYFRIQPQIPLFYSLARPAEHLAAKEWLFLIPAISGAISFIHLLLINVFHDYDRTLITLFSWTTVAIQVVLSLALIRVLWIIS
jgi:hypothetical protein